MDTENKEILENDVLLPDSIEVDKIIEFYKEIETEDETEVEEIAEKKITLPAWLSFFKREQSENPLGIQTTVYGLSQRGRIYLYRGISLAISLCIIAGAFVLAYFLPGNEAVIAERQNELRKQEAYVSLKSRHGALKAEVEDLRTSNEEKQLQVEQISDIDNTKAQLRTDITAKQYELNDLYTQIGTKQTEITELDTKIAEITPPENILPPGKYIAGKNIAAGKYTVTGTGKFMVASADGKSKVNTTLGSTPLEVTIEATDVIKFDSKVKFTSAN